jgi:hypothetical protein
LIQECFFYPVKKRLYLSNGLICMRFRNISAWNGRSPSRQISYSSDQKLLQIR